MTPDQQTALDIMAGTERDVPIVDPRTVPVRFSNLKKMAQSPKHYWHAIQKGYDQTLSMRLGSGAHAMLFGEPWTVWTGSGNGKKPVRSGKAWEKFALDNAGKVIMSIGEYRRALPIVEEIKRKERAYELLTDGQREQTIRWQCLDRACVSRPDVFKVSRVVELKTTKCSDPVRFANDGRWRAYHAQIAFYLDAVLASGLGTPDSAYVVAVESTPPYPVTVLRLTERAIDIGRRMCRLWLEQVLACEAENYWPGYLESDGVFDVADDEDEEVLLTRGGVPLDEAIEAEGPTALVEEVPDEEGLFLWLRD